MQNIHLDYQLIIYIITIIINLVLGLFVWSRNVKKRVNKLFGYFTLSIVFWIITLYLFYNVSTQPWLLIIGRLNFFFTILLATFLYFFSGAYPEGSKDIKVRTKKVIRIETIILSILTIFTPLIDQEEIARGEERETVFGALYILFILHFVILILLSIILLIKKYKTSKGNRRFQIMYLFTGIAIAGSFGAITNIFFPVVFQNYSLQPLGPLSTAFLAIAITYSIIKHRLFGIKFVIGRTLYLAFIAIIPYATFYGIFFLQEAVWGGIFESGALITGFFISIIFIYSLLFANTQLTRFINENITNPGYDPIKVKDTLIKALSSELDTGKVATNILSTFHTTLKPKGSGIIIFDLNNRKVLFRRIREMKLKRGVRDLLEVIYYWDESGISLPIILEEIMLEELDISDKQRDRLKRILTFMRKRKIAAIFPLNRKVQLNGILLLGTKENDSAFTVQDVNFIESIVANASVAIGRSLLYRQVDSFAGDLEEKIDLATEELEKRARQLKRKNTLLEQASKRERDMMDIVGHELRTPATIAKNALGYIMMLRRMNKLTEDKIPKYVTRAQHAVDREIRLINTFLGATKIEGGQMQFEPRKFSIVELIKQVVAENRYRAKDRKLKLKYKPTRKSIPQIEADRTRMTEVIDNLLSNAIKYTREGRVDVWCDTNTKKKTVSVYVKDTGEGISRNDQKRLFKKFGRIKNHVTKKERMARIVRPGGTGLGLYLVKGIINLHGGEIEVKSKIGKGSTFWFTLPLKHKIGKKNLINPIFKKDGEKDIFKKLKMKKATSKVEKKVME